eukprot:TRINITY_DN2569_c0_g1_i2.p2 TRINITY_DN2569_c0_g1~~TRINITY_DN2569_c0_g1_i2.p2  ORF type:complete len:109 (-),score=11.24 TRINITY_DN2569_c0_g1_i2:1022-1318(-)
MVFSDSSSSQSSSDVDGKRKEERKQTMSKEERAKRQEARTKKEVSGSLWRLHTCALSSDRGWGWCGIQFCTRAVCVFLGHVCNIVQFSTPVLSWKRLA